MSFIKAFLRGLRRGRGSGERRAVEPLALGFHGDRYLLALVDELMKDAAIFVETGTNVGSTARYVGARWPNLPVHSCEPDLGAFETARAATADLEKVTLYNLSSQDFLKLLYREHPEITRQPAVFWLDAHDYGYAWPLRFEVEFITTRQRSAAVLIDDFEVPDRPQFRFSAYEGQTCNFEHVRGSLCREKAYRLLYPQYTERTSATHPLAGYAAILFGDETPTPRLQEGRFSVEAWPG